MFGPSSWQDDNDDEDENEDGNEDGDAARMWHN